MDPVTIGLMAGSMGLSALSKGGKKKTSGPSVVTMPEYSFTEPRLKLTSDFISQNIERMMEGKYPAYYEEATPHIRRSMQNTSGSFETLWKGIRWYLSFLRTT